MIQGHSEKMPADDTVILSIGIVNANDGRRPKPESLGAPAAESGPDSPHDAIHSPL